MSEDRPISAVQIISPRNLEEVRIEIDRAISTAKQYPRDEIAALEKIEAIALRDPDIAAKCYYVLPGRWNKKENKRSDPIMGPGVRLLELFQSQMGNCHTGVRVVEIDNRAMTVTAQAVVYDLEKNIRIEEEATRRFYGHDESQRADSLLQAKQAAQSIAFRNVQRRLWGPAVTDIYEKCMKAVADGGKPSEQAEKALVAFEELGGKREDLLKFFDLDSTDKATRTHVLKMRGLYTAVKDGYTTLAEALHRGDAEPAPAPKDVEDIAAKLEAENEVMRETVEVSRSATPEPAPAPELTRQGLARRWTECKAANGVNDSVLEAACAKAGYKTCKAAPLEVVSAAIDEIEAILNAGPEGDLLAGATTTRHSED